MAAPVVAAEAESSGNSSNPAVALPADIASGELLEIWFASDANGQSIGTPTDCDVGVSQTNASVFNKTTTGSEGSTIVVPFSPNARPWTCRSKRITGQSTTDPPEYASATGTGTSPDAPNLTPSLGSKEYLWSWGVLVGDEDFGSGTVNGFPTNYTTNGDQVNTTGTAVGTSHRANTASSENPGTGSLSTSAPWTAVTGAIPPAEAAAAATEQEGFRWGVDDGNEASHGWEAAQDTNISIANDQSRLLRLLVNATNDPSSTAYSLRVQKNGSGGYVDVPVGASTETFPSVVGTAGLTQLTSANPGTVTMPSGIVAGELLIAICAGDTSGSMSQSGGSDWSIIGGPTNNGTAVCGAIFAKIAAGSDTLSVQFEANDFAAVCFRVQNHGVSNVATDITVGTPATGSDNAPNPPNCDPSNGTHNYLWIEGFASDDDDNTTNYETSGWTPIGQAESAQSTSSCMAAAAFLQAAAASQNPGTMAMAATEEWVAFTLGIPPLVTNNEAYITTSGNIAAGGEATTARLTAPSGKTTSDFTTGRRWDDENGGDSIDIAEDFYTELEWLVALSADPEVDDFFDFRVYADASPLDTYTLTPRWTVGSVTSASGTPVLSSIIGSGLSVRHIIASGAPTTSSIVSSGVANRVIESLGVPTISPVTASGSSEKVSSSSGNALTPLIQSSGQAAIKYLASGSPVLAIPTANGTGLVLIDSTGAAFLAVPTSDGQILVTKLSVGSPSIVVPVSSGQSVVTKLSSGIVQTPSLASSGQSNSPRYASGGPIIPVLTSDGSSLLTKLASGFPNLSSILVSGATVLYKLASGDGILQVPETTGAASVGSLKAASGSPIISSLMSSGESDVTKSALGATVIPSLSAVGIALKEVLSSGNPLSPSVTSVGEAVIRRLSEGSLLIPPLSSIGNSKLIRLSEGSVSVSIPVLNGQVSVVHVSEGVVQVSVPTSSGIALVFISIPGYLIVDDIVFIDALSLD